MPDDRRVDLSHGLEKVSDDLLDNVRAAAVEVKRLQEAGARKDASVAQRAMSRRTAGLVIAVAAVVLLVLSYWMIFVRANNSTPAVAGQSTSSQSGSQATKINNPVMPNTTKATATTPPKPSPRVVGHDSQVVEHPSDEFEQPSSDPGM